MADTTKSTSKSTTSSTGKVAVSARVPAELGQWLREQAAREQRDLGVVVGRAIATYRLACEADGLDRPEAAAALPLQGSGAASQALSVASMVAGGSSSS